MTNTPEQDAGLAAVQAAYDKDNADRTAALQAQADAQAKAAQIQADFDAYKAQYPPNQPPPPPPPASILMGASFNGPEDVARLQGWGVKPKALRNFNTSKLPTTWQSNKGLMAVPAGTTVVISYHTPLSQAEMSAFVKSVPASIVLIMCYFHEPEDNFLTASAQAQVRSDMSAQGKMIHALGVKDYWCILMGFSFTDAGHRQGRDAENFIVPEHTGVGVDFYDKLDMTNIMPLTVAFAAKHGIEWGITECGRGKVAADTNEETRIAYAKDLIGTAKAQSVAPRLMTWYDYQKSATSTDYRLTQPVAQAFIGV